MGGFSHLRCRSLGMGTQYHAAILGKYYNISLETEPFKTCSAVTVANEKHRVGTMVLSSVLREDFSLISDAIAFAYQIIAKNKAVASALRFNSALCLQLCERNNHKMDNIIVLDKITFSETMIKEIARDSAEYLLNIFEADDNINILGVICIFAKWCMEHNEVAVYCKILGYCRRKGYELPQYYNELAANPDDFDFYARQLVYYMTELSR